MKPKFKKRIFRDINPQSGHKKAREIFVPNDEMRLVHNEILKEVRSAQIDLPSATCAIKGGSCVNNVLKHKRKDGSFPRYFYLLDLKSAYKNTILSTTLVKLSKEYPEVFTEYLVLRIMKYCILPYEGLVTGGPASPELFNICMEYSIDRKLRALAEEYDLVYTRYLDDLTFSSDEVIGRRKRNAIVNIIMDEGLVINHDKTNVFDLTKNPVEITGVGLRQNGKIYIPSRVFSSLKALLHRAITKGGVDESVVYGKLALFVHLMRRGLINVHTNKTQKKVYELYLKYKRSRQK